MGRGEKTGRLLVFLGVFVVEALSGNGCIKSIRKGLAQGWDLGTHWDRKAGQAGGFLRVCFWTVHKRLYQFNVTQRKGIIT